MLVYANHFRCKGPGGAESVVGALARWLVQDRNLDQDAEELAQRLALGMEAEELGEEGSGAVLESAATRAPGSGEIVYPHLFCARLRHPDRRVRGRTWVLEVGLRHPSRDAEELVFSVLLQTEDTGAATRAAVRATCPGVVPVLLEDCAPLGTVPGCDVEELYEEEAPAFKDRTWDAERRHPIVLLSFDGRSGGYMANPEGLLGVCYGLADVVRIPRDVDTWELQAMLGKRFSAYHGAINVLFAPKDGQVETDLLLPQTLEMVSDGEAIAMVLETITARTNKSRRWKHTPLDDVHKALAQVRAAAAQLEAGGQAGGGGAETQPDEGDGELERMFDQLAEDSARYEAQARGFSDGLLRLWGRRQEPAFRAAELREALEVAAEQRGRPSLEQQLQLEFFLHAGRIAQLRAGPAAKARQAGQGGQAGAEKVLAAYDKALQEHWQGVVPTMQEAGLQAELDDIRDTVAALRDKDDSRLDLGRVLVLVAFLYPERVVVLKTAADSAEKSDRDFFRYPLKAYRQLAKLAGRYWAVLADPEGGGDSRAREIFGDDYSAKEAVLSDDCKAMRTFAYKGKKHFMQPHLKIGTGDNRAETLRIHFKWLAGREKRIVIGHCGEHLPFGHH